MRISLSLAHYPATRLASIPRQAGAAMLRSLISFHMYKSAEPARDGWLECTKLAMAARNWGFVGRSCPAMTIAPR